MAGDITAAASAQACALPLSATYSLLPRAHTYLLIIILFVPLPQGWVFRGAIAALTTRTAVYIVDAIVLLASLRRREPDPVLGQVALRLDALPQAELLALSSMAAAWLLLVSRRVAASSANALLRLWALCVGIGGVLAYAVVRELAGQDVFAVGENAGSSSSSSGGGGGLLVCPHHHVANWAAVGQGGEATVVLVADGVAWFARRIAIPAVVFAPLAMYGAIMPRGRQYGGMIERDDEVVEEKEAGRWYKMKRVSRALLMLAVVASGIVVIVFAEQFYGAVAGTGPVAVALPELEGRATLGQWSVWAATAVVLFATAINGAREGIGGGANSKEITTV